nr:MAG TPA: hypothetical protein [Caudoviricetes sp.]
MLVNTFHQKHITKKAGQLPARLIFLFFLQFSIDLSHYM